MRSWPRSSLSFLSLLTISGCSFATHFEDYTVESGPLVCSTSVMSEGVTELFSTVDAVNAFDTSCGGGTSPDVVFEFTAPATTYYRVTTAGSSFDTTLAVRQASCDPTATEYACNNDDGVLPTSEVIVPIARNERVLVLVDGNSAQGDGQVLVERISCPADALSLDTPVNHTTVARPNDHTGACGGAGGDHAYRFVPEADGMYSIRAIKTASQTRVAVYVDAGPECGGQSLGCNAGADGRSEVVRFLQGGEPFTVWVDALDAATDGGYTLAIEARPDSFCEGFTALAMGVNVDSIPETGAHQFSTSCAGTSVWWNGRTDPAEVHEFPDRSFTFETVEIGPGCGGGCNVEITAHFPFAAEILDGTSCGGPVRACGSGAIDETDPLIPIWTQTLDVPSVQTGQDKFKHLIIDRLIHDYQGGAVYVPPTSDDVTINIVCYAFC